MNAKTPKIWTKETEYNIRNSQTGDRLTVRADRLGSVEIVQSTDTGTELSRIFFPADAIEPLVDALRQFMLV